MTLEYKLLPEDADVFTVLWKSSDPETVTVNEAGKIYALKAGRALITATSLDGEKQAVCNVTVKENTDTLKYKQIFKESFGNADVWEGDTDCLLSDGMTVNYSGETKTIKSKEMFFLGNEFVLTVGYQVSGNEGRKYNTYSSVSFADIELRIFDNASKIELLQNSKIIGRYEGLPTSDSSAYSLKYKNGEISVTKGGEKIISAAVQIHLARRAYQREPVAAARDHGGSGIQRRSGITRQYPAP